jgi:hypothetical protein
MIKSLIIGIGVTVILVLAWVLVQIWWKNAFKDEYLEDDVLVGRKSCSNCGCTTVCKEELGVFTRRSFSEGGRDY